MSRFATLAALLSRDPLRLAALQAVAALMLPDGWIGAGFVRDAVWDQLHGHGPRPPAGDVDVIWFDPLTAHEAAERAIEGQLRSRMPHLDWSARNQARMHLRNGDAPYQSVADAMRHWPETATAIAARLRPDGAIDINAPFGVDDLFALRLRPTPSFATDKRPIFQMRVVSRRWLERYPGLQLLP
ncbi:MAG TPA: nucleotidyltransferase family protein [Sphingobium sp.]|nr:nucleotidyltransferase family protein [Sphingobium sp.]